MQYMALCVWLPSLSIMFVFHPCCRMYPDSVPCHSWIMFYFMDTEHTGIVPRIILHLSHHLVVSCSAFSRQFSGHFLRKLPQDLSLDEVRCIFRPVFSSAQLLSPLQWNTRWGAVSLMSVSPARVEDPRDKKSYLYEFHIVPIPGHGI